MTSLVYFVAAAGLLPLFIGYMRLARADARACAWPRLGSVVVCTLAFNLTFFWQELWLVIPKAFAGLAPVLFHNDHDWTVRSPVADLLQGTGALATFSSGLAALAVLLAGKRLTPNWRLFAWWMVFQGLFQSLTQVAIGCFIAGNDVGRALGFLGVSATVKSALLGGSVLAMALVGAMLAAHAPAGLARASASSTRALAGALLVTACGCVLLSVPFREPREWIEVVMIPIVVNVIGTGWVVFGAPRRRSQREVVDEIPGVAVPLVALVALLGAFQFVLRPGVHF